MRRFQLFLMTVALLQAGGSFPVVDANSSTSLPRVAEVEDERGVVALDQALRELTAPFSAMYVAVSPNDVDEASLAYLHRKLGARVVIVFATRGEGHDSPFVAATGLALGLRRTREALQLTRALGADAFFLNLADFGCSQTADEALRLWGHDEALGKLVRAIRLGRPDVILTSAGRTGDGQSQAIKRLAGEAFDAAADRRTAAAASDVWQPQRLFERNDTPEGAISIDLTEPDPVRGRSYAELGRIAHSQLASYGGQNSLQSPLAATSFYRLARSLPGNESKSSADPLSGLILPEKVRVAITPPRTGDASLLEAMGQRDRLVESLGERLLEKRAEGGEAELRERYGVDFFRIIRYRQTLERALALALGLSLELRTDDAVITPGQKLEIHATLRNASRLSLPVVFQSPEKLPPGNAEATLITGEPTQIAPNGELDQEFSYDTKDCPLSLPHEANLLGEEFYPIGSTLPGAQPPEPFGRRVLITAQIQLEQVTIPISSLIRFDVAPVIEISTVPFLLIKDWASPREVEIGVRLRNRSKGPISGSLWVVPLAINDDTYEPAKMTFPREDAEIAVNLKLRLPILKPPLAPDVLLEFRRDKPAPPEPLGTARIVVKAADAVVASDLRVGIVSGPDASLPAALDQLGVRHEEITPERVFRITHGNAEAKETANGCDELKQFDAIIVDHFAYLAHPESISLNVCLQRYAQGGGNLVVLGQVPGDLALLRVPFSPAALTLSADRVASAGAPVQLLDATHPLLAKPNQLAASDFDGWAGERAQFTPIAWGGEFTALLDIGGSGEGASRSALLAARSGEGWFVYSTLSLNRQWREGVPGAYRLLANMISLGRSGKPQAGRQ